MKKKTLKLESLKVQSFVTGLTRAETNTFKAGDNTNNPVCNSEVNACQRTIADVCRFCTCGNNLSTCPIILTCDCHP